MLSAINAAIGFRAESVNWRVFGVIDTLLKLGFGLWMFLGYPAFTYFG